MTAVADPVTPQSVSARREDRLIRLLERASASSRFNLGERWLFALGGALVVGGFIALIIGWEGASRTVLVAGQIPYLISGGLIGLGLVFLGAFLYFGHWVAVLVRESRERGAEDRDDLALVRQSIDELNRNLSGLATAIASGTAPLGASSNGRAPVRAGDETAPVLLATATGTLAHRPGCRALAGKEQLRSVGLDDGLKMCGLCRPLDPDIRA
jgi:hypothetical protein